MLRIIKPVAVLVQLTRGGCDRDADCEPLCARFRDRRSRDFNLYRSITRATDYPEKATFRV